MCLHISGSDTQKAIYFHEKIRDEICDKTFVVYDLGILDIKEIQIPKCSISNSTLPFVT